jgi:hypothetical protein
MATSTSNFSPQQSFSYNGGAFGSNPAPINLPNPSADLNSVLPGVPGTNNQLSGVIQNELSGQISPDTMNLLQNQSAARGVSSGMPWTTSGNNLNLQNLLTNAGLTSENQVSKGVSDYNSTIPTISSTQTLNPALQLEGNTQNAMDAAAPDPGAAANEEQQLLQQYMAELNPQGNSWDANKLTGNQTTSSWTDLTGANHPEPVM